MISGPEVVGLGLCFVGIELRRQLAMEIPLRDAMLLSFVDRMHLTRSVWDDFPDDNTVGGMPTTMADFDSVRQVCRSWEASLEETVEGASHRLARWDFSLIHKPWCSQEELMKTSFDRNYPLFANSWELTSPIADDSLRVQPLDMLSVVQLADLRAILEDVGNVQLVGTQHGQFEAAPNKWISPKHRNGQWLVHAQILTPLWFWFAGIFLESLNYVYLCTVSCVSTNHFED